MILTMIHDIYSPDPEVIEITDDAGNVVGVEERDILIRENVKTPIYLEEEDIRMIIPHFNPVTGRRYSNRSIIKVNGENYVVGHSFKDLTDIKRRQKHRTIKGFK